MKFTRIAPLITAFACMLIPALLTAQEFSLELEVSSSLGAAGGGITNLTLAQVEGAIG